MRNPKSLSFFLSIIFLCFFSLNSTQMNASTFENDMCKGGINDTITVTFKVNGTSTCKSNIESVLTLQTGVISAVWDSSIKQITIVFKSTLVKTSDLHSFLAMAGYDTSELRAKQGIYDALPSSCKYTREAESE